MHAQKVGELIGKQDLIGVPFAGGLSELPFLNARQILINDMHHFLYDLYWAVKTHESEFIRCTKDWLYHPCSLDRARDSIKSGNAFDRAVGYFIINWLTRCAGGMEKESDASLSMRWTASGGSSIARWRSAVEGLPQWAELLKTKCECTCLDWRDFAKKWKDRKGHAIYVDPPWIAGGDDYLHKFTTVDHMGLAEWLGSLKETAVVVRHNDCPAYRQWYPESSFDWEWFAVDAKNQHGNQTREVLIRKLAV